MSDRCFDCKYYVNVPERNAGECHEDSPKIVVARIGFNGPEILAAWPPIKGDSWCGNFLPKLQIAKSIPV